MTSVETVWEVHGIEHDHDEEEHGQDEAAHEDEDHAGGEHADEHDGEHADHEVESPQRQALQERGALRPAITALLVTYRNASAAVRIPSVINRQTELQAAVPAVETARLLSLFGASVAGAQIFGWLMAGVAGLAIFVALIAAVRARAGDLALLRVMGARRRFVFGVVLAEGLAIALIGLIAGVVLAYALVWLAVSNFDTLADLGFEPLALHPGVGLIAAGVLAIAVVSALAPALRVYGADVLKTLARS